MRLTRTKAGYYTVSATTMLNDRMVAATFTIVRDDSVERVAGRPLWPITATVNGSESPFVLGAGTSLAGSRWILGRLIADGFVAGRGGEPEPAGGYGSYEAE